MATEICDICRNEFETLWYYGVSEYGGTGICCQCMMGREIRADGRYVVAGDEEESSE